MKLRHTLTQKISKTAVLTLPLSLWLMSCGAGNVKESVQPETQNVSDLYIVDCLLPGQVRKLGSMNYIAPRRPIRTTTADCEIRGGEYVEYDRADYRTALKVWLAQAEQGEADAQNYVGEIFEKGLGQEPDYKAALSWYEKAAEQGHSRAQINLGYLYEQGLGTEKNVAKALNLYRSASGIEDDELVFSSESKKELKAAKDALNKKIIVANAQSSALKNQMQALEEQLAQINNSDSQGELVQLREEVMVLRDLYMQAEADKKDLNDQLNGINLAYRNVQESELLSPGKIEVIDERTLKDINFGRFFAVIIGNEQYRHFDDLRSPMRDAEALKDVLENQYGFTTLILPNADEKIILNTLNELSATLTAKDNLLIYYAGHGNISDNASTKQERGYWLPIDARRDSISSWINNAVINDHLDRLAARSILVIADSCYAGQLGAESSSFLFGTSTKLSERSIRAGLSHRSRTVISSGGVKPVLDGTNINHSVFALSLLDVLKSNKQVLRDSMLFSQLAVNVKRRNAIIEVKRSPEMKPIRSAGHEGGSFYFIPNI